MVRYMLSFALALALVVPPLAQAQATKDVKVVKVKGKWVKVQGTDQFFIQTTDNKEMPFYTATTTRYVIDRKPVKIADFKSGNEVTVVYVVEGDRKVVQQVYVGEEPKEEEGTFYEGQVVKVVGKDQVIIKTADNKEITIYVDPKTTYLFDDKPGVYGDLKPGTTIRVDYDLRERRAMARSIRGVRPRR